MRKNTSRSVLRCTLVLFSVIFIITNSLIFVGTLLLKAEVSPYSKYIHDYQDKPTIFLIVGTILGIVAGLVGIISVIQEWIHGLIVFAMFILYLFISMVALEAAAYFLSSEVAATMYSRLKKDMDDYSMNKGTVDELQNKLTCCGTDDYMDWFKSLGYIPGSCCQSVAFCDTTEVLKLHLTGCHASLKDLVEFYAKIIFFVLAGLGIVELCLILNSLFLICSLRHQLKVKSQSINNNNNTPDSMQLPRIHNPLGQSTSVPTISLTRPPDDTPEPVYVRRPPERNIILAYKNQHENYLHRAPQQRFDNRRLSVAKNKYGNPPARIYDSSRYS